MTGFCSFTPNDMAYIFSLPAELRLQILEYCLTTSVPIRIENDKHHGRQTHINAQVLRINKKIYREARKLLYRQNTFCVHVQRRSGCDNNYRFNFKFLKFVATIHITFCPQSTATLIPTLASTLAASRVLQCLYITAWDESCPRHEVEALFSSFRAVKVSQKLLLDTARWRQRISCARRFIGPYPKLDEGRGLSTAFLFSLSQNMTGQQPWGSASRS